MQSAHDKEKYARKVVGEIGVRAAKPLKAPLDIAAEDNILVTVNMYSYRKMVYAIYMLSVAASNSVSKAQLAWHVRTRLHHLLIDGSDAEPAEVAIYTLSDPRNLRQIRYVGQTTCPRRRYLQHVGRAKLWLPDETAWWIKLPKVRPLYEWIRELYCDEHRLPVMVVVAWTERCKALHEVRRYIQEYLSGQLPLLNREGDALTSDPAPNTQTHQLRLFDPIM